MQRAMLNRATIEVADTTEVSGRVTADSIKHELYAKKQSSLWRLTICGFCKVCSLVAATLILPAMAHAQNNQGNGGSGINLVVPNGTYAVRDSGYVFFPPGSTTLVPIAAVGRTTFIPTGTTNGLVTGTTSGLVSFSFNGQSQSRIAVRGTFTVNADGSVSVTETQLGGPGLTLHFDDYPTADGNTIMFVATDPGSIVNGVSTR
jgi:hypothetical protein